MLIVWYFEIKGNSVCKTVPSGWGILPLHIHLFVLPYSVTFDYEARQFGKGAGRGRSWPRATTNITTNIYPNLSYGQTVQWFPFVTNSDT